MSELLDGAYYHLGLCVKYYPPDEELAEAGAKYAELHRQVGKRLSAEQVVALDMKISAHELNAKQTEQPSEAAVVAEPPVKTPVENAQPSESHSRNSHAARTAVSVGLGVLGAAGVGVGVGFIVDAQSKRDEAMTLRKEMLDDDIHCTRGDDNDSSCDSLAKLVDRSERMRTTGVILTASGGTLLVGSVLLYLLWPQTKTTHSALNARVQGRAQRVSRGPLGSIWLRPDVQVLSTRGALTWGVTGGF